jgi:hypothetical protein
MAGTSVIYMGKGGMGVEVIPENFAKQIFLSKK